MSGQTSLSPDWPGDWPEVTESVLRCLRDGSWGKYCGPNHDRLERRLGEYFQVEHVVLCASGTVGVELALRGARVSNGDEVVMSGYDFKANFQNILTVNATPVLVDVLPNNKQLDLNQAGAAIGPTTKAILASHLHGGLVDMTSLMSLAKERGVTVIEDACQCPGAKWQGQRVGSIGHVGVISFGGSKLLSAGRGGAVLTNQADIAQRIRLYTQRGNESYPLSELQAAAVLPQLETLDLFNEQRLCGVRKLQASLPPGLTLLAPEWVSSTSPHQPAYYKLGLLYDGQHVDGLCRDEFSAAMRARGIALDPGFRALHLIHSRRRFRMPAELPESTDADQRMLVLHHPILRGDDALLARVIAGLRD